MFRALFSLLHFFRIYRKQILHIQQRRLSSKLPSLNYPKSWRLTSLQTSREIRACNWRGGLGENTSWYVYKQKNIHILVFATRRASTVDVENHNVENHNVENHNFQNIVEFSPASGRRPFSNDAQSCIIIST